MDYGDNDYASDIDGYLDQEERAEEAVLGAPIDEDALGHFIGRGRSIKALIHPYLEESIVWIASNHVPRSKAETKSQSIDGAEASLYQAFGCHDETSDGRLTSFILKSAETFEDLQIAYNDDEEADVGVLVVEHAKVYKDNLDDLLGELQERALQDDLNQAEGDFQTVLVDSMIVWCCAEAIYLTTPGTLLCDGLMDWVNRSNPQPAEEDGQDILAARTPYLHPGFWDFVCKGIIRGLFEMVGQFFNDSGLLDDNSSVARATSDLCLLLRTCPRVSNYGERIQDFKERHKMWRAKITIASRDLRLADPELNTAFKQVYELLKGDRDAVHRQCDTWQECLAAMALLFDPAGVRTPSDVKVLFEMITESEDFGLAVDRTLAAEEACAALCIDDIPTALTKCKIVDLALATHLADLLEKAEILEDARSGEMDMTIRDILVYELGEKCMAQRGTWHAAITYWRSSGDIGLDSIQEVIARIPAKTQDVVDDLLNICQDLEMMDEASEIESLWARQLELNGQHNQAVLAYDRASNVHQMDRINWQLFGDSLLAGHVTSQDEQLREALQSPTTTLSTTISCIMAPYATLAMMYQLKEENNVTAATTHLAALLTSSDVPKDYIPLLMAEMLPFLKDDDVPFSQRELFDSLAAIEEYHDSKQYQAGLELLTTAMKKPVKSFASQNWRSMITSKFDVEDVLSLVRLRLARAIGTIFCT